MLVSSKNDIRARVQQFVEERMQTTMVRLVHVLKIVNKMFYISFSGDVWVHVVGWF